MIAGPSEILVLADGGCNPAWVAADLLSQAEHDKLASRRAGHRQPPTWPRPCRPSWRCRSPQLPRAAHRPRHRGRQRQDHRLHRPAQGHRSLPTSSPRSIWKLCVEDPFDVPERDQKRRQHLPGPQRARRPWATTSPAPTTPCPPCGTARFSSPLWRGRLRQEVQLPLLHPRGTGRSGRPALPTLRSARACTPTQRA